MKKLLGIATIILSMIIVLVFAGGCLGQNIAERVVEEAIEKALESESGGNVEIDLENGEVNIQSDEGEVSISSDDESVEIKSEDGEATFGTGAELPEGFPEIVPLYADIEITSSFKSSDGDKNNYSITAESQKSIEEIFNWYKDELSGWSIENEFKIDSDSGKNYTLVAKMGDITLTLGLLGYVDKTGISLTVTE